MKTGNPASIGAKIRGLRVHKGWSQAEVARRLETAPSTYREWEQGRKISAEAVVLLARLYEISASDILDLRQGANIELAKAIEHINIASVHLKNALASL